MDGSSFWPWYWEVNLRMTPYIYAERRGIHITILITTPFSNVPFLGLMEFIGIERSPIKWKFILLILFWLLIYDK